MPHVIFDGSQLKLASFNDQTGSGLISYYETPFSHQRGFGSFTRQHGAGVGSVIKSIFRYLRPLATTLQPIGKAIGNEALQTTARILDDVTSGKGDLKESITKQSKEGLSKLLNKASENLQKPQQGSGRGRRKRSYKHIQKKGRVIIKPELIGQTVPARSFLKKKRADSLGYY